MNKTTTTTRQIIILNMTMNKTTTTKRQIDSSNETRNADFRPLLSFVEFIVENNVVFTKMTTKQQQQQWIL